MKERAEHLLEGRHIVADLPGKAIKPAGFTLPAEVAHRAQRLTPYERQPEHADLICTFTHGPRKQLWFLCQVSTHQAPEIVDTHIEQTLADGTRERVWFKCFHNRTYQHQGRHFRVFMRVTISNPR